MTSLPKLKTFLHIVLLVILVFSITSSSVIIVKASTESDLQEIQRKLEEIRKKKANINKQLNDEKLLQSKYNQELFRLKSDIDLLGAQIEEKELTIKELELKIEILNKDIKTAEENAINAQYKIDSLQTETDSRLINMYISQKTHSEFNLFIDNAGTDFLKLNLYQSSIQEETNEMLEQLTELKDQLAAQKVKLEEDKNSVLKDETQIQEEKIALEKDKASIEQQRSIYYQKRNESLARSGETQEQLEDLTEEEQYALAEQRKLEQIIFNRVNQIPNGSRVTKGTIIGRQGCTGYCTGPHLHFATAINGTLVNPCSVLPGGRLSNCGSGTGQLSWPMDGSFVLTSGYGWRWGKFHGAIDTANYTSNAYIKAAHDGFMIRGFEPCSSSNPLCKNGGANYVIICEVKSNCNSGKKTMYWHLANS